MKIKNFVLVFIIVLALALTLSACTTDPAPPQEPEEPNIENPEVPVASEWWELVNVDWEENVVALDTGINMTYLVMGPADAEPIILIHGATDSRISWSQVAPILAENYRVYVPELRGHGKTDKPEAVEGKYSVDEHTADIVAFMDIVGIETANIVGHSLGSMITQNLAINNADKVTTITLIGSTAKTGDMSWILDGDGESFLGLSGYDAEQALPDDFIRGWAATTNEDANFAEAIYQHAAALPYPVWAYIFSGAAEYDNLANLSAITCPVLIIWGSADELMSAESQQALQDGLVNAEVEYVEIADASHNTHWDSQAIVTQVAGLIADMAAK